MMNPSFGRKLAARVLQFAIGILALVVVPVAVVFSLAPHSPRMASAALYIARAVNFAISLPGRDKRCSIADVWTVSRGTIFQRRDRIFAQCRIAATDGRFVLAATPAGNFWIPAPDYDNLAAELAEQEEEVYGHGVLRPGDVVLDCGANVGVYTRVALAHGARIVVAIDLAPEPVECLRRNFENEIREGRVIVYPKGVWDKDATLRLHASAKFASAGDSVVMDRGGLGPEVPLTTIDKLVAELKLPRVDVIKMDIEGSEAPALTGAAHTLATYKPRLAISMEHKQSDPEVIPALVQRLNPNYQTRCTECGNTTGRIQPEVLLAW
ncbi:MAG: FkbM family methyltransferase [Bryobacteraceae bacterium]